MIVVCFVALMQVTHLSPVHIQSIARGSSYLILRIAEKQVGEQDMEIISNSDSSHEFLINQVCTFRFDDK